MNKGQAAEAWADDSPLEGFATRSGLISAFIAGYEHKEKEVGMVWVKCSERFPAESKNYFLRHPYEDGRFHGWWSHINPLAIDKEFWLKMQYEWLDESTSQPSPPDTGLREALERIVNMKLQGNETTMDYAFNRCWHIATEALNQLNKQP